MISVNKNFAIMFFISAALAFTLGGTLPYYILYFLSMAFIIGFIYILLQKFTIDAEVHVREKIHSAGDFIEILTVIKSGIFIPTPYVLIKSECFTHALESYNGEFTNITSEENSWIRNQVKFYGRGIFNFGSVEVTVTDFFQIINFRKAIDSDVKIKVYPKIYKLKNLTLGGKDIYQQVLDKRSTNEDIFAIKDVRKYRHGDSLKKVHWKVSAKHGELFVKNSDNISGEEFVIFLDMNNANLLLDEKGSQEESMVDLCVSLVKHMQLKGINARVFFNCEEPMCMDITTKEKFDELMDFLITQSSDGKVEFCEFIYKHFYKVQRNNRLALIVGNIDERLCSSLSRIRGNGYGITLFYCSAEKKAEEKGISRLRTIGIECCKISDILNANGEGCQDGVSK
jgi:hypothetical protein